MCRSIASISLPGELERLAVGHLPAALLLPLLREVGPSSPNVTTHATTHITTRHLPAALLLPLLQEVGPSSPNVTTHATIHITTRHLPAALLLPLLQEVGPSSPRRYGAFARVVRAEFGAWFALREAVRASLPQHRERKS